MGLFVKKTGLGEKDRITDKQRGKIRLMVLAIFIVSVFIGFLDYPVLWDKAVNWVNTNASVHLPQYFNLPFRVGLDLQGGTHLVYEADLSTIATSDRSASMDGIRDVIERRVNLFGVTEPLVQVDKSGNSYRLLVDLPGVKDVHQAIDMIGATPYLEFKEQRTQAETDAILQKQKAGDAEALKTDAYFKDTQLTGRYLKKATLAFDQNTSAPHVTLEFTDEGGKIFAELTKNNVGKLLAIYLDGAPIEIPRVEEEIPSGKAQITGNFTVKSAQELVQRLNAGALPVPIKLIGQENVGPSLGKIYLDQSLRAGLIGLLAVAIFMVVFYRKNGLLANLALVVYIILNVAIYKIVPVTLTLAGIAGFILSIGMAVDANILIFERMKEERKLGRDFMSSINEGFRRAWPSIRDGHITTLATAAILYQISTSSIKGFALTLFTGVALSLFTAVVITRIFLKYVYRTS